jgi:hypothetical protein
MVATFSAIQVSSGHSASRLQPFPPSIGKCSSFIERAHKPAPVARRLANGLPSPDSLPLRSQRMGVYAAFVSASSTSESVRSLPNKATLSKMPGEIVVPAIATRTGWKT